MRENIRWKQFILANVGLRIILLRSATRNSLSTTSIIISLSAPHSSATTFKSLPLPPLISTSPLAPHQTRNVSSLPVATIISHDLAASTLPCQLTIFSTLTLPYQTYQSHHVFTLTSIIITNHHYCLRLPTQITNHQSQPHILSNSTKYTPWRPLFHFDSSTYCFTLVLYLFKHDCSCNDQCGMVKFMNVYILRTNNSLLKIQHRIHHPQETKSRW